MSVMRLMCGPSGAGKTTYAKQLAEKYPNARYLNIDEFYKTYHGGREIHDHEFEVWIQFFEAIHAAEQDGVDVIIDTNAPSEVDRVQFIKWFNFDRYCLYVIDASWAVCKANNQKRTRKVPEDYLAYMHSHFFPPKDYEYLKWNTITWLINDGEHFIEKSNAVDIPYKLWRPNV